MIPDLESFTKAPYGRPPLGSSALVILSGGQDSATCLAWAQRLFARVEALTFDYGQRHRTELDSAAKLAARAGVVQTVIPINSLTALAQHAGGANALTNTSVDIKEAGGFRNLPSTFVPGRNALFLTLAASFAAPRGLCDLVIGACETDYSGYPDCRDGFMSAMESALSQGLDTPLRIHRPLMKLTKAQTFELAAKLGVLDTVIKETHTCYVGVHDQLHAWGYGCGRCPACELRKKGWEQYVAESAAQGGSHGTSRG